MQAVLTEEHEMIRDSAREFAERSLKPNAAQWDRDEVFPQEALAQAAEMGFLGLTTPEKYDGAGMGTLMSSIMVEELNRWGRFGRRHRFHPPVADLRSDRQVRHGSSEEEIPAAPGFRRNPRCLLPDRASFRLRRRVHEIGGR